jgi:hypothetical protein
MSSGLDRSRPGRRAQAFDHSPTVSKAEFNGIDGWRSYIGTVSAGVQEIPA